MQYTPWLYPTPITAVTFTPEGGLAIGMINKTGAVSIKGMTVDIYRATAIDGAVDYTTQGVPDCIGAIYDAGVVDGGLMRVVVAGIAQVMFVNAATRGYLARTFIAADNNYEAGKALSEAVPSAPFATDRHFSEIGHIIESTSAPGLARVVLHFN
jgi:hypothetical protein